MMTDLFAALSVAAGTAFFMVGTIGLLRLPDVYCRLHALTKADNLGLGLIALGAALASGSWVVAAKLFLVWLLVMSASAVVSFQVARRALESGTHPWTR